MYRSERKRFEYSLAASVGTHLSVVAVVFLLSLIVIPPPPPKPPEDKPVEVEFTSDSTAQETPAKAEEDAPNPNAPAPELLNAPPSPTPPLKAPTEETPPPPPPPQPMPPPPEAISKVNVEQPVQPQAMESPSPSAVTLPPTVTPLSSSSNSNSPAPPSPSPVPTALPTVQTFSKITKTEKAPKETPDTHSLESTLDAYRADQKQTHAPKAKANPRQGGAPNGGGARNGDITKALSAGQQGKIASSVRRCYVEDTAAKDYEKFSARLVVTVDASGEARVVTFDPSTKAKMNADPSYRALAERARDAVLSPTCSKLPIPSNLLGKTSQLRFVFRP
ncbi:energy transducer TonB [Commensalibacter oyaizuii]|uniref:Energy transducer TonB n=1 Tax=Commensalibacter oyaizuii TaxID=3043873 RepID=A0ABT6PYE7_9PROT|nr:energy transducer TonB [Commensalibacter sp. TBRC 16381]MDI2089873.1 energy transducer TonB [Commensalibacter sp. TBRC 16381]